MMVVLDQGKEIQVRSYFEAWREEVETELERIRSIPMRVGACVCDRRGCDGSCYANEDPW